MINYSVIIPVSDRLELLNTALLSIPDREDIQVIVVYNGYSDQETILSHINVSIKNFNLCFSDPIHGAGGARNIGLSMTVGRFVLFLDSDDYFIQSAFEVFDNYLTSDIDIVYFKPSSILLSSGNASKRHIAYCSYVDEYIDNNNDGCLRYKWSVPWSKLFRTSFLKENKITFEEIPVSNDIIFSLHSGYYAKKVLADPSVVYIVTESAPNESLIQRITPEYMYIRYMAQVRNNLFLREKHLSRYRIRLLGAIVNAYRRFGINEAIKYVKYAIEKRVSVV